MRDWKTMGDRLALARMAKNMTQAELEKRCGMGATWICQMEKGRRRPSVPILFKICQALEISSDWLIGLPTYPTRP